MLDKGEDRDWEEKKASGGTLGNTPVVVRYSEEVDTGNE